MRKTLCLIRHGMTAGNQRSNYIGGRTDESLCRQGAELLKKSGYPPAAFCSISSVLSFSQSRPISCADSSGEGTSARTIQI